MTNKEMLAVIKAHADGKAIEYTYKSHAEDWIVSIKPCWNFGKYDYRVKPEFFECWINIHPQYTSIYSTERAAMDSVSSSAVRVAVHMREVV